MNSFKQINKLTTCYKRLAVYVTFNNSTDYGMVSISSKTPTKPANQHDRLCLCQCALHVVRFRCMQITGQIAILLHDGNWLHSENLIKGNNSPVNDNHSSYTVEYQTQKATFYIFAIRFAFQNAVSACTNLLALLHQTLALSLSSNSRAA